MKTITFQEDTLFTALPNTLKAQNGLAIIKYQDGKYIIPANSTWYVI